MKNYTPGLINAKNKKRIKTFLLGSGSINYYYEARHNTEDIYLLWIESIRFGKTFSFPCVLDENDGDPMVYITSKALGDKVKNNDMIQRWNLMVNPQTIHTDYTCDEISNADFQSIYRNYKDKFYAKGRRDALAQSSEDGENAQNEDLSALPESAGADCSADAPSGAGTALNAGQQCPASEAPADTEEK